MTAADQVLAVNNDLPLDILMQVSRTYTDIATKIIGEPVRVPANAKDKRTKSLRLWRSTG